jgi:DNA repair protein RadC
MGALYVNGQHRLVDEAEIYRGTLNRAAVEPRGILQRGLLVGATGFVLFHTHPSGDPSPSAEDLAFTERLFRAAEVVGTQLIDHLVLGGPTSWVSLRERGGW